MRSVCCYQVVYGRWLIEGYPKVVLLDVSSAMFKMDEWKQEIWDSANIGVPYSDREAIESVVFGYLTYLFLQEV